VLGLLAIGALLCKRHKERPQRPFDIWGFDVSKQVLSMLVAHICGLAIAALVAEAGQRAVSDCAWYLVAFTFDTTLGLALAIGFHTLALNAAKHNAGHSRFAARVAECGSYGTPPQWTHLWPQLVEWITAVVVARFVCGSVVFMLRGLLIHIARALDSVFRGHPFALLYFVMLCCPLLMNLLQAIIQDMALKWKKSHGGREEAGEGHSSVPASDLEMGEGPLLAPSDQKSSAAFVLAQTK